MQNFSLNSLFTSNRTFRFLAFVVDAIVILLIAYLFYTFWGDPDFAAVQTAMENYDAVRGTAQEQEAFRLVMETFDRAYVYLLLLTLGYELVSEAVFKGATLGKLIFGFKIVPAKAGAVESFKSKAAFAARIIARSVIKVLFIYLFSGIPFLISSLTIFSNQEFRSGVDIFAGTKVISKWSSR